MCTGTSRQEMKVWTLLSCWPSHGSLARGQWLRQRVLTGNACYVVSERAGVLTLSAMSNLDQMTLFVGACPVHCRMVSSISDFYPLGPISPLPVSYNTSKMSPDIAKYLFRSNSPLAGKHCHRRAVISLLHCFRKVVLVNIKRKIYILICPQDHLVENKS